MKLIDKIRSFFSRRDAVQIQFIEETPPQPSIPKSETPISQIPPVYPRILSYAQPYFTRGRGFFHSPEWDLSEIGKIIDVEGYVRQAFKKKEGLMFKEGVGLKGANPRTLQYIKRRMAGIARASRIPTIELYKRVGRCLIQTSNAFVIKVRDSKASQGRTRKDLATGKTLKPVAGYFLAPPETMQVDFDKETGKVHQWRQMMPSGEYRLHSPENVIHFTIDKREGFLYGTPVIVPVKDDIRALRTIEENIEMLLYQHLFPLFHYKVGTETAPAGYAEDGTKEVDAIKDEIRVMPAEGAIVTPERHEITAIGAEGRAVRAEGYLKHFQERVWSGLGVSSVDMGIGDLTNRATANTMSRALVDSVKDIQDSLEAQWDLYVIQELLLESTFGDNVLEEQNMVHLHFNEIDLQNKMEMENHHLEMFKGNAITYSELRAELNREPIEIPEDPEDQDPNKYPEWHQTSFKLFEEPINIIRAMDEPYLKSLIAAGSRSSAATSENVTKAQQETIKTQTAIERAKKTPRSDFVDNLLTTAYTELGDDLLVRGSRHLRTIKTLNNTELVSLGQTWASDLSDKFTSHASAEMVRGFNDITGGKAYEAPVYLQTGRTSINNRIDYFLNRLANSVISQLVKKVDDVMTSDKLATLETSFKKQLNVILDAHKYRVDFMWDMELKKAYNLGRALGARYLGFSTIQLNAHGPTSCERCQTMDGLLIPTTGLDVDNVPPFHPHSRMTMKVLDEEEVEDQTKLERCVKRVKKQVRKDNPGMSEEKVKSKAFAICNASLNKKDDNV